MPTKGKILVIRGGAIGDFILTLPVLAALREHFPQARLEVLGYPHIVGLALAGGLADAVQPIESQALAGFFARDGQLAPALADYFSEFAVIISYLYDPDLIFQTNLGRVSRAQFIVGPHRPDDTAGVHATQVFLRPLERLAIFDADTCPHLVLEPRPLNLNEVALHPGSGSERKNWPEGRWSGLLERLVDQTSLHLLLVGGEAEGERVLRLAAGLPPERVQLAVKRPLPELAQRLASCGAFVGHDSGISHLAAALGLPSLLLWGETVEAVWHPPGKRVTVFRSSDGLSGISLDAVFQEASRMMAEPAARRSHYSPADTR